MRKLGKRDHCPENERKEEIALIFSSQLPDFFMLLQFAKKRLK